MKCIYVSNDHKVFDTEEACLQHEREMSSYTEEKQRRRKELQEAMDNYYTKLKAYEKDYSSANSWSDIFAKYF